jgi:hypothetical protein
MASLHTCCCMSACSPCSAARRLYHARQLPPSTISRASCTASMYLTDSLHTLLHVCLLHVTCCMSACLLAACLPALPAAQHGARITLASFLPSRGTSLLLSGDARGRLCLHAFSSLLLRTNVSSKVLANGQYGPLLGISHLAPFTMPAPGAPGSAAAAAAVAGGRGSSWSAGVQGFMGGTPPLSPKGLGPHAGADEAAWRSLFEVRGGLRQKYT